MVCEAEKVEKALRRAVDSHENLKKALHSLRREMESFDAKKKLAKHIATEIQVVGGVLTFLFPTAGRLITMAGTGVDLVTDGVDVHETKECYDRIERHFYKYGKEMKQLEYITEKLSKSIATLHYSKEHTELERYKKDLAIRMVHLLIKAGFSVKKGPLLQLGFSAVGTVSKNVARGMAVVNIISSVQKMEKEMSSCHPTISTINNILESVEEHRRSFCDLLEKEVPVLKEKERKARLAAEELRKKIFFATALFTVVCYFCYFFPSHLFYLISLLFDSFYQILYCSVYLVVWRNTSHGFGDILMLTFYAFLCFDFASFSWLFTLPSFLLSFICSFDCLLCTVFFYAICRV